MGEQLLKENTITSYQLVMAIGKEVNNL